MIQDKKEPGYGIMKAGINRKIRIMLVEDDGDDQEFFTDALFSIDGIRLVSVCDNGKLALDWLETAERLPDIIFTDINMPVMGGIEMIRRLKSNPRTRNIKVVVLSTDTAGASLSHVYGVKKFILKGPSIRGLNSRLEHEIHPWLIKINLPQRFESVSYLKLN